MAPITTLFTLLTVAASMAFGAPIAEAEAGLAKRGPTHEGDGTFYNVADGKQVACGGYYQNSDYVVAANPTAYKNGARCGRKLTAHHNGNSVTVTLVDECPECAPGSLDFSPSAFKQLAPAVEGRIHISWAFDD